LNNLLEPRVFCPIVRKTDKLRKMDEAGLRKRSEDIVISYPPELVRRAFQKSKNYLCRGGYLIAG